MGRNASRGKVAYNWISPDPAKAGPTLRVVVVVVVVVFSSYSYPDEGKVHHRL